MPQEKSFITKLTKLTKLTNNINNLNRELEEKTTQILELTKKLEDIHLQFNNFKKNYDEIFTITETNNYKKYMKIKSFRDFIFRTYFQEKKNFTVSAFLNKFKNKRKLSQEDKNCAMETLKKQVEEKLGKIEEKVAVIKFIWF